MNSLRSAWTPVLADPPEAHRQAKGDAEARLRQGSTGRVILSIELVQKIGQLNRLDQPIGLSLSRVATLKCRFRLARQNHCGSTRARAFSASGCAVIQDDRQDDTAGLVFEPVQQAGRGCMSLSDVPQCSVPPGVRGGGRESWKSE
jgi:hypothetical protein